jgi:hypothetical protein
MPKNVTIYRLCALLALAFACTDGFSISAQAGILSCRDRTGAHSSACAQAHSNAAASTRELAAQSRPRIIVHPRRVYPGPYAKRYCYAWLRTEYRLSGTVITPQMRCWWH